MSCFSLSSCASLWLCYNSITAAWTAVRRSISTVFVESDLRWESFHQTMAESVWRSLCALLFTADSVLVSSSTFFKSATQETWAIPKSCKMSDPLDLSRPVVVGDALSPLPSHSPSNGTLERNHSHYCWKWHSLATAILQRSTLLCRQSFWQPVEMTVFPAGCSWRPCMCPSNNPDLSECSVCWKHRSSNETRWSAWKSLYISDVCELTTRIY